MKNILAANPGLDLDAVTFDSHGEAGGIDDDLLDGIAGGLMEEPVNDSCSEINKNCC